MVWESNQITKAVRLILAECEQLVVKLRRRTRRTMRPDRKARFASATATTRSRHSSGVWRACPNEGGRASSLGLNER